MSTPTPKLGLNQPDGNETVSRQAYIDNLVLIDQNAAKKFIFKSEKDVLISGTDPIMIATYTPASNGNFMVGIYLRLLSQVSISAQVTYTDKTGIQTTIIISEQVTPSGSYSLLPIYFNAENATISVFVQSSSANQVYASASIMEV